jgi:hypothetical protein
VKYYFLDVLDADALLLLKNILSPYITVGMVSFTGDAF